jgi:murein DD-endopeptidase MepM/ murein hydrolase activator NlpD
MRKSFWVPITLGLAAFFLLPLPGLSAPLTQRIDKKRSEIEHVKRKEGVLTTTIQRFSTRIESLHGEINATRQRLDRAQLSLDRQKAELLAVRDRLEQARDRLERLRSELATARGVLAARLVKIYKTDAPDALTVVLEADGFGDLLERAEFLERISDQDREIVARVKVLKARAQRSEGLLAKLEDRKQTAAETILARRDDIASTRDRLASAQGELRSERNGRRGILASVRQDRRHAEEDLAAMERQQGRIRNSLAGTPAGPIRRGSGRLIWPVNGAFTSPFGMRWGRLHAGIDIAAPTGTAIRAADTGTVRLAGSMGGYGNYTCIQHTGSLSTCYGHQSSIGVSVGQGVRQGQTIGAVGNTGNSTGPHLHFETRINGNPVDPMGYL